MFAASYSTQDAFIKALNEHLRSLHKPFAGAHFRVALIRDNDLRFLTGCVEFQDRPAPSRGVQDYGSVLFTEEWAREQGEAINRLSRLISGQEKINGYEIKGQFQQSFASRDFHFGVDGRPTWRVTSHLVKSEGFRDYYPPQVPLLGYDLKPYLTMAHAVNEWIFGIDFSMQPGASFQNQWTLITVLPDLRVKIVSAEWVPGTLHLNIELRVPADQLQLQIVHSGSAKRYQLLEPKDGEQQMEIPGDARKLSIFVVDRSDDCLAQLHLSSLYECFGKESSVAQGLNQSRSDLAGGETDTVEFKPFLEPKNAKEGEFIKTVVAFANTHGGRVYVGVDDDGVPQGETELCRVFRGTSAEALTQQVARLKELIRERVKPVPIVDIQELKLGVDPILVAEVQRGRNHPYATHQNQIYVRKGATSRTADPSEIRTLVTEPGLGLDVLGL